MLKLQCMYIYLFLRVCLKLFFSKTFQLNQNNIPNIIAHFRYTISQMHMKVNVLCCSILQSSSFFLSKTKINPKTDLKKFVKVLIDSFA